MFVETQRMGDFHQHIIGGFVRTLTNYENCYHEHSLHIPAHGKFAMSISSPNLDGSNDKQGAAKRNKLQKLRDLQALHTFFGVGMAPEDVLWGCPAYLRVLFRICSMRCHG